MKKISPLGDRVVVTVDAPEEVKQGEIITETKAKAKKTKGDIVALGPKVDELKGKEGKKVLFGEFAGTELTIDGVEYRIIPEKDVIAVL